MASVATKKKLREALLEMIGMVKNGQWCRDKIYQESRLGGQYCALGLAGKAWTGTARFHNEAEPLLSVLDQSIVQLPNIASGAKMNGGTSRGTERASSRIATYNNTRTSEDEIVEWFERALELV